MSEFEKCRKKRKLVKISYAEDLIDQEIQEAQKDLAISRESFQNNYYKWSIIQGYYAMFHAGKALLLSKGYREKSHYCLCVGLRHLFVETNLLPVTIVEALSLAKALREAADYRGEYSKETAEEVVENAGILVQKATEILKSINGH